MPNSNTYLSGLGAILLNFMKFFVLNKQKQRILLSSERARDELTPLADKSWGHSGRHHPSLRSYTQLEPADGHTCTCSHGSCHMCFFNVCTKGSPLPRSSATIAP